MNPWFLLVWVLGLLAAYVVLVLLVRASSYVVLVLLAGVPLLVLAGLGYAVALPWRVLWGRGPVDVRQLTPDDVVAGAVVAGSPPGESRHFPWDSAWPTYLPYQARADAASVLAAGRQHSAALWSRASKAVYDGGVAEPRSDVAGSPTGKAAIGAASRTWIAAKAALIWTPTVAYLGGLWLGMLVWFAVVSGVGVVAVGVQKTVLAVARRHDVRRRRRRQLTMACPRCYHVTDLPSYRCDGPDCAAVHRRLLPGPLGLAKRRCGCGQVLPATVTGAIPRLTPECPACGATLALGSGGRHTVQLPVAGAVGAGKTRFLGAAVVALANELAAAGGGVESLTAEGAGELATMRTVLRDRAPTAKTPADRPPVGLPLRCWRGSAELELHLMDPAGERFAGWDDTEELGYFSAARAFLFVLDPLALPLLRDEMLGLESRVPTAEGDQEAVYGSVFDRMRAAGIDLRQRKLGVVVVKADIVAQLPSGQKLNAAASGDSDASSGAPASSSAGASNGGGASSCAGASSDAVRDWLAEVGADRLVDRMRRDFGQPRFFLVDSMGERRAADPLSPLRPLRWALRANRSTLLPARDRTDASGKRS